MLKRVLIFLLIIIALGVLAVYYPQLTGQFVSDSPVEYQREQAVVTRVIDGDTLEARLGNALYVYRLLGINTPEKKMPYSDKAVDFIKELEGKEIELLRDKEDIDKYGRKLRYIFYEDELINAEILQEGLATSFMINGLIYQKNFKDAENFAKTSKIGIWKESSEKCAECIKLNELNAEKEYFIIENKCSFTCNLSGWFVKDDANHFFYLKDLNSNEIKNYNSKTNEVKKIGDVWNNDGDRFFMRDDKGNLVIFYEYSE